MSLQFQEEKVADCWNEIMPLANAHWSGTQSYRRHQPFSPSFARYEHCNNLGMFTLYTARDGTALVGYFGVYVTPSMHSQQLMATEDTFFLLPDYRGGRNALRFLHYIERQLRLRGVMEIMFSCEIDNETGIKKLLEFLDYQPVIMQYSKQFTNSAQPELAADSGVTLKEPAHVRSLTPTGS